MTIYQIDVMISKDFGRTCMGFDEDALYQRAASIALEAETPEGACEIAFGIYNSYPDELHCDERYLLAVEDYRGGKWRSLSVGDVVMVDGKPFSCERTGWKARG